MIRINSKKNNDIYKVPSNDIIKNKELENYKNNIIKDSVFVDIKEDLLNILLYKEKSLFIINNHIISVNKEITLLGEKFNKLDNMLIMLDENTNKDLSIFITLDEFYDYFIYSIKENLDVREIYSVLKYTDNKKLKNNLELSRIDLILIKDKIQSLLDKIQIELKDKNKLKENLLNYKDLLLKIDNKSLNDKDLELIKNLSMFIIKVDNDKVEICEKNIVNDKKNNLQIFLIEIYLKYIKFFHVKLKYLVFLFLIIIIILTKTII